MTPDELRSTAWDIAIASITASVIARSDGTNAALVEVLHSIEDLGVASVDEWQVLNFHLMGAYGGIIGTLLGTILRERGADASALGDVWTSLAADARLAESAQ